MESILSKTCAVCNKEFTSIYSTTRYCSQKCRMSRHNNRKKNLRHEAGKSCVSCGVKIPFSRKKYCDTCSKENKYQNLRNYIFKIKYGISVDEYNAMLESQNGVCAVCKGKTGRKLSVDHDHKTGKVRGLLCVKCNLALGYANDNKNILLGLVEYLDKF